MNQSSTLQTTSWQILERWIILTLHPSQRDIHKHTFIPRPVCTHVYRDSNQEMIGKDDDRVGVSVRMEMIV